MRQLAVAAVALGALSGCGTGPSGGTGDLATAAGDGPAVVDLRVPDDLGGPADLTGADLTGADLTATGDLGGPEDLAKAEDLTAAPPDLAPKLPDCTKEQVLLLGGTFMMGANDLAQYGGTPVHQVTLSPFCLDLTEVTLSAYKACVAAKGCTDPASGGLCNWGVQGRDNHPVNCTDWEQAQAFCKWAGSRLPTEAQWEYVARYDDQRSYPWGNTPPGNQLCWGKMSGTCAVKSFPAGDSKLGVSDVAGNVAEWVTDCYDTYPGGAATDPSGPAKCPQGSRVARGGGWVVVDAVAVRSAFRLQAPFGDRNPTLGFRCARVK